MQGLMTQSRLDALIAEGYGSGRDENYKSWIRVRRRLSSPVSNLHRLTSPKYVRPLHLLSGLEFGAVNVALWLGCSEVREQHPFWPEDHPHPSTGRNAARDHRFPFAPGLLSLAKTAGIKHGVYPGTRIPFVATIDFTLSLGVEWDRIVHWSCKPRSLLETAPNRERMLECIHLETLYSEAVDAKHVVIDGTDFTGHLIGNLDWFRPLRSEWNDLDLNARLGDFTSHFMSVADDTVNLAMDYAAEKMRIPKEISHSLFRMGAWNGFIDIDAFEPVILSRPLRKDALQRKQQLSRKLLGEVHA